MKHSGPHHSGLFKHDSDLSLRAWRLTEGLMKIKMVWILCYCLHSHQISTLFGKHGVRQDSPPLPSKNQMRNIYRNILLSWSQFHILGFTALSHDQGIPVYFVLCGNSFFWKGLGVGWFPSHLICCSSCSGQYFRAPCAADHRQIVFTSSVPTSRQLNSTQPVCDLQPSFLEISKRFSEPENRALLTATTRPLSAKLPSALDCSMDSSFLVMEISQQK